MKFRRRQIETYCTYITYQLTLLLVVVFVLYMLIDFFNWDVIPHLVKHILERLVFPVLSVILATSAGLSLWLNFSVLSTSIETIANKGESAADEKFQLVIFGKKILKVVLIVAGCLALLIFGLNTYDTVNTNKLFNEFKSTAVDSTKIIQLTGYLNRLNRNDDFIYKDENCESVLVDDTCLGYSNIQTLASIKKILNNMKEGQYNNSSYEIFTTFKGQLINISIEGVSIQGIFVDYVEVYQHLYAHQDKLKKEIVNGFTMYTNDSERKTHKAIIDLMEPANSKLYITISAYESD